MKSILKLAAFVLLAAGSIYPQPFGRTRRSSVAEQLNQIEQQLAKAAVSKDIKTFDNVLAPDWTSIDITGHIVTKAQVMRELESEERRIETASIDDVKVREFGKMAIVTGRTTATGSYRGQRATVVLRFTDIFVKRNGRWQVVASQGTIVVN